MAAVNLIGSYNYALVALSVLIAMFASYAALDLAARVTAADGWTRAVWLLGGAGAMGTGIWSMHYIGMLGAQRGVRRLAGYACEYQVLGPEASVRGVRQIVPQYSSAISCSGWRSDLPA